MPADLARVILKCLEKKPGDRHHDAKALARCADSDAWDGEKAERWWRSGGTVGASPAVG